MPTIPCHRLRRVAIHVLQLQRRVVLDERPNARGLALVACRMQRSHAVGCGGVGRCSVLAEEEDGVGVPAEARVVQRRPPRAVGCVDCSRGIEEQQGALGVSRVACPVEWREAVLLVCEVDGGAGVAQQPYAFRPALVARYLQRRPPSCIRKVDHGATLKQERRARGMAVAASDVEWSTAERLWGQIDARAPLAQQFRALDVPTRAGGVQRRRAVRRGLVLCTRPIVHEALQRHYVVVPACKMDGMVDRRRDALIVVVIFQ